MKKHSIGIMQGRLTSPKGRGIQFFPFENWKQEFNLAKKLGLNHIEWIFDLENYRKNPLWTKKGRKEIKDVIKETGVVVHFICADYFMRKPFHKKIKEKGDLQKTLKSLIEFAKDINASVVEIPLLDNSSLATEKDENVFVKSLLQIMPHAKKYAISILLEADLAPDRYKRFIQKLDHPLVNITYDSGNSSGIGYNPKKEFMSYGKYIANIHIKDRLKGGTTMPLGTGSADFTELFKAIKKANYKGPFVLQAARGEENKEADTVKAQIKFLKNNLLKHLGHKD